MSDCSEICAAAEAYFDALHTGDADRLRDLFVPEANLYAASDGELKVMPVADYLALVAGRDSPASQAHPRSGHVVSIDMSGPNSAVAKVNVAVPPTRFVDLLSFLRVDEQWRIVSKVYHVAA